VSIEPGSPPPLLGTLDYLSEVAKDWAEHQFAAAKRSDYALAPHRFELRGTRVRRRRIPPPSAEAESPLAFAETSITGPTAWCRADTTLVLSDTETGTIAYEQEIVEVLVVDGHDLLAEAAFVARMPGFPPCLGRFLPVS
jgi:hypothetical protein